MPHASTVADLGAATRAARRARGWTQSDLAHRAGVSREWVVRFEKGSPRLEAQAVLDVLTAVGLSLSVTDHATPSTLRTRTRAGEPRVKTTKPLRESERQARSDAATPDPFADVFAGLQTKPRS